MANIYDQYDAAFANMSAYVVLCDGERVAKVAFKFPKDGAGRLYAYVHWIGMEMVRGHAGGCGYDKRSAAVGEAACKMAEKALKEGLDEADGHPFNVFCRAIAEFDGRGWERRLEAAGFKVIQAV